MALHPNSNASFINIWDRLFWRWSPKLASAPNWTIIFRLEAILEILHHLPIGPIPNIIIYLPSWRLHPSPHGRYKNHCFYTPLWWGRLPFFFFFCHVTRIGICYITRAASWGPDRRKWLFSAVRGGIWTPHSTVLIKISADKRPLNQLTVKNLFFSLIIKTFCH